MIGAYLWAKRGTHSSPYQYLFALYIGLILLLADIPALYVAAYVVWLGAGEGPGWKPKHWRNGEYLKCVGYGLLLGGLGALLVPLSTIVSDTLNRIDMRWKYEWNEYVFGAMFEGTVLIFLIV